MVTESGCCMARRTKTPLGALAILLLLLLSSIAITLVDEEGVGTVPAHTLASYTGSMNVTVTDNAGRIMPGAGVKIAGNASTPVTTGPGGFVLINGLYADEAGTSYFAWAARDHYENSTAETIVVYANATANVTLVVRGGTVFGQVVDTSGSPLEGANVSISDEDFNDYNLTDSDGTYRILGVPSGLRSVSASAVGYYPASPVVVDVPVGELALADFELAPLVGNVSGHVLSAPGLTPLEGATVSITVYPLIITTQTNASGYYHIDKLVAGTYNVTASKEGYTSVTISNVPVLKGENTTLNFTLEEKATRLYGVVKSGNVLKSKVNITIVGAGLWTLSGFNGSYSIVNITAGTYNVTATLPGYYTSTIASVLIPVGGETKLDMELVPLPGGVLQGYVLSSEGNTPIVRVNVTLIGPGDETYSGQTDPNGAFQIPALGPGNYTIQLEKDGFRPLEIRNIVITPENITSRNFTMEPIREGFQGFFFGFDLAHSMMIVALFLTILIFGIAVYLRMRSFQTPLNAPAVYDEAEAETEPKEEEKPGVDEPADSADRDKKDTGKVLKRSKE